MHRKLVPSPGEEIAIIKCQNDLLKKQRLIIAREQSVNWSKKRTAQLKTIHNQKEIQDEKRIIEKEIQKLQKCEDNIQRKIDQAHNDFGKGYQSADYVKSLKLDELKKQVDMDNATTATLRHVKALREEQTQRNNKAREETYIIELKAKTRKQENERSKEFISCPLKKRQPLIEIPKEKIQVPLNGLDAFTKTYYHLPTRVGVVDEKSMESTSGRNAIAEAEIVQELFDELNKNMISDEQARLDRADVRGTAALDKVKIQNLYNDMVNRLERYAVLHRTKKYRSSAQPNIFADAGARDKAFKQFQQEMEHAVEDILDKNDRLEMALQPPRPPHVPQDAENCSSVSSIYRPDPTLDISVLCEDKVNRMRSSDGGATLSEFRSNDLPSNRLYFPLQSDLEGSGTSPQPPSPSKNNTSEPGNGTSEPGNDTSEPGNETTEPGNGTSEPGNDSRNREETDSELVGELLQATPGSGGSDISTLSEKIRTQVALNQKLRQLHGLSFNVLSDTSRDSDNSLSHPAPFSFTPCTLSRVRGNSPGDTPPTVSSATSSSSRTSKSVTWSDSLLQEPLTEEPSLEEGTISPPGTLPSPRVALSSSRVSLPSSVEISPVPVHPSSSTGTRAPKISSSWSSLSQHTLTTDSSMSTNSSISPFNFTRSTPISRGVSSSSFKKHVLVENLVAIETKGSDPSSSASSKSTSFSAASTDSKFSNSVTTDSGSTRSGDSNTSMGRGLEQLQSQLLRINSHLKQIQAIKEEDDAAFGHQ